MKQLIITADDYGVFPAINNAVLDCVEQGKINSVSVFANFKGSDKYPGSVKNLERLIAVSNEETEIGCHLTITSGKPLTGNKMAFACDDHGYFLSYTNMRNFKYPEQLKALEDELCAQVEQLESINGFKVRHLTNHHNSLTLLQYHFDVYMNVARKFDIPMRSADIRPVGRQNFYMWYLDKQLRENINAIDRDEIDKFQVIIRDHFKANCGTLKSPQILDSRHYGPVPLLPFVLAAGGSLVKMKKRKLDDLYEFFKSTNLTSMELLVHLAKPDGQFKVDHSRDLDYPGVDRSYFDSRAVEFESIMTYNLAAWEGIDIKSWKYLNTTV